MDRHVSRKSPVYEPDQDQNVNRSADVPYNHMGRIDQGNSSSSHLVGVTPMGWPYVSQCDYESRPSHHSSSRVSMGVPHACASMLGSSLDSFPCPPASEGSFLALDDMSHDAYDNHYNRQGAIPDPITGAGRGPLKRKGTGVFIASDRGSMGRYFSAGSSSSSSEQPVEPALNHHMYPPVTLGLPHSAGSGLSIATDDYLRNVRYCPRLELGPDPRGRDITSHSSHHYPSATLFMDNFSTPGISHMNPDTVTHDRNCIIVSPTHQRTLSSEGSGFTHETNRFVHGRSSTEGGGDQHRSISRRNHVSSQYPHASASASREVRSSYYHRVVPTYSHGPCYHHTQQGSTSNENGPHPFSGSNSSRNSRPFSTGGWHQSYRHRRSRMTLDQFETRPGLVDVHERMGSETVLILDRSNLFDQHMEMRLNIDDMSYEELLALGERIGNVSTGVSECMLPKCLIVTAYCSSDENHNEEAICAICLDVFSNNEDIGKVKSCGHSYHSRCIMKWLSIKNACPICKAAALSDSSKED